MFKKLLIILLSAVLLISGCTQKQPEYSKYKVEFYDTFDTMVRLVIYEQSEEAANKYAERIHDLFLQYHKLFDAYNNYDGINNIKSINDNAGKGPIEVSQEIVELLTFCRRSYDMFSDRTDISMGAVLAEWSEKRADHAQGVDAHHSHDEHDEHEDAQLPDMDYLRALDKHTGMENIVIDENIFTVELIDENTRIDVGAVAKGYATEKIAEIIVDEGLESAIINAGGNVRTIGVPKNGNEFWSVGIENPMAQENEEETNVIAVTKIKEGAVVSSGDYQRYYIVDGVKYHHLIDPDTLMPADKFRSVSVIGDNSAFCDFLSTSIFMLDYEEGRKLIDSIDGYEAMWIHMDGSVEMTDALVSLTEVR